MKLHNSLTKLIEDVRPLEGETIRMYSCGPTVYNHVHIGNLSSFIYTDILKRSLKSAGFKVKHVMNITDVDDKTIKRSYEEYPNLEPKIALQTLTRNYEKIFKQDMQSVGNSIADIEFIRATESIPAMQVLISTLYEQGFAYIAKDGVYFSIDTYRKSGKTYGQLIEIDNQNVLKERISNDEYDKDFIHDFVLWKVAKPNEPFWQFELDGKNLAGRPGWHIECSAMSSSKLGLPFDIHTGGIDLMFPHHENEIAQSTAGHNNSKYAKLFFHNEHLLVDGKKMSKSLNNFYTIEDIINKGFSPIAFRLMILQSGFQNQSNFTWDNLKSAQNRLNNWLKITDKIWQVNQVSKLKTDTLKATFQNNLDTPNLLTQLDSYFKDYATTKESPSIDDLKTITDLIGIDLIRHDITDSQKQLIKQRESARKNEDYAESDILRRQLKIQGIDLIDINKETLWTRI